MGKAIPVTEQYSTVTKAKSIPNGTPSASGGQGLSDVPYLRKTPPTEPNPPEHPPGKGEFAPLQHVGPIRGISVYPSSVVVHREGKRQPGTMVPPQRGEITEFSPKSRARLAFVAYNTDVVFHSIITLTWPEVETDGAAVKVDFRRFEDWFKYHFPDDKILWGIEFQERGAPHFHVATTVNLAEQGPLTWVRRKNGNHWQTHWETWQKLVAYWEKRVGGLTSWEAEKVPGGGNHYIATYTMKMQQKDVPEEYRNVGRFWGHSKGVKPEPRAHYECTEAELKSALEKGDWEYIESLEPFVFKELYQAANKLDTGALREVPDLEKPSPVEKIGPYLELITSDYVCQECGVVFEKWAPGCPDCKARMSLQLVKTGKSPPLLSRASGARERSDFTLYSDGHPEASELWKSYERYYGDPHGPG